jgi:DNA-binding transcriptional LysR family regulator
VLEGVQQWTVADQFMKREVILQGMGCGHVPSFLISQELREKRLLSIAGKHFPGSTQKIVAARRRDVPHGPIANQLWEFIEEQTPAIGKVARIGRSNSRRRPRSVAPVGQR